MQIPRELIEAARRNVPEISAAEAKARLDRGEVDVLLDVRELDEWQRGHIAGAVHIPMAFVEERADPHSPEADPNLTAAKEAAIVVHCAQGVRSLLSADALKKMGYSNVVSMSDGIVGWAKQGFPIER